MFSIRAIRKRLNFDWQSDCRGHVFGKAETGGEYNRFLDLLLADLSGFGDFR